MFLAKIVKKIKTHILCPIIIFPANPVVCETMRKNIVEPDRTQMTNNARQENELSMLSEQGRNRETHTHLIGRRCFDTTTIFRERLSLLSYALSTVHYLYCFFSSVQLPFVGLRISLYIIISIIIIPIVCTYLGTTFL